MDADEYKRIVDKIKKSPGPIILIKKLDMSRFPFSPMDRFPLVSLSNANNANDAETKDPLEMENQDEVKKPAAQPPVAPKPKKKKKKYVYTGYKKAKKRKLPKDVFDCKSCNLILENMEELKEHESTCDKIVRETVCTSQSQEQFFQYFGLVPTKVVSEKAPHSYPVTLSTETKIKRVTKFSLTSYFKNNPIPINSMRGRTMALSSEFGRCSNVVGAVNRYNKWCGIPREVPKANEDDEEMDIEVLKEKKKEEEKIKKKFERDYTHEYSFTKRQKKIRKIELYKGVKRCNWRKFRACIPFKIRIKKMSDAEIDEILNPKKEKNSLIERKIISLRTFSIPMRQTSTFKGIKLFM